MDERDTENGEELVDESGRNATQREIDERGPSERPADVEWEDGDPVPQREQP
jgi:hypothetical protein